MAITKQNTLWAVVLLSLAFFLLPVSFASAQQAGANLSGIEGFMYDMFITIGGFFLSLGGPLLDLAITKLVIGMNEFIRPEGTTNNIHTAINNIWQIIRDMLNFAFIFGLIYIGFKTILGIDENQTRKWLISLIGAALLINFSFYFTQLVIDFSNIAATQIYNLIVVTDTDGNTVGISEAFMDQTRISTYTSTTQNDILNQTLAGSTSGNSLLRIVIFGLLMMCFMLITAFVFIAGAIILIMRFLILILCMIFSPVMFLGWIYPGMNKYTHDWLNHMLKNAFLAPAFLFMIYISLTITQRLSTGGVFASAFSADGSSFEIFLYFFIIIGFMIASIVVAKKMGSAAAAQSINIGHSVRRQVVGAAGGATFGLAASGMRSFVGRRFNNAAESGWLKDGAAQSGPKGWAYKRGLLASRKLADSSFDARKIAGVGKKTGLGEGAKGGYKSATETVIKKEKEFARSLGEISDDDPQVSKINTNIQNIQTAISEGKRRKAEATDEVQKIEMQKDIDERTQELAEQRLALQQEKNRRQVGSPAFNKERPQLERSLKEAQQQVRELKQDYETTLNNPSITAEERTEIANKLLAEKKKIKEYQSKLTTGGYAQTLKQRGALFSFLQGRDVDQNKAAGEAILKEFEKKLKETKEDKRTQSLVDSISKLKTS